MGGRRAQWSAALTAWRQRWRCPDGVELREADHGLRIDLSEPAHLAIMRAQLNRAGQAILAEAADPAALGWIDGYAHEIVVPLVAARPPTPSPLAAGRHLVPATARRAHLPGARGARRLSANIYTHPDRQTALLAEHLPRLLAPLGEPAWWFVRYRDADGHHLRLRIAVTDPDQYGAAVATVDDWAEHLHRDGLVRRLVLDTYEPEVGRYGDGPAMAGAEAVFAADSVAILAQLRGLGPAAPSPAALGAANMVDIVRGFTGGVQPGMMWLADHADTRRTPPAPVPRALLRETTQIAVPETDLAVPLWATVAPRWRARRAAVAAYRGRLASTADAELALESLLHLHHVRAIGLDRDSERVCRRLARAVALTWRAHRERP